MSLDVFKFYRDCLLPLTPPPVMNKVLNHIIIGGETTDDFAQILMRDQELQYWVRLTVQRMGYEKRLKNLSQIVALMGQDRIRDLIIGRHIERKFFTPEESILGLLLKKKEEDLAKAVKDKNPKKEATDAPNAPENPDEEATIPPITDFVKYLQYGKRSETVAVTIRNSYPGQAYTGGILFDFCKYFLRKHPEIQSLQDPRLKNTDTFVDTIFTDGLRCAVAANEMMKKISIAHQKTIFLTALIHNIGKVILLAYDPKKFERAFSLSTGAVEGGVSLDSAEAESLEFDLDHAQAGSLYVGRLPFLADINRSIDYHHNPKLLLYSSPDLYALTSVLRVSGAMTKLYQKTRQSDPDIQNLPDQRLRRSDDFLFLKLNEEDWEEIKASYALQLLKLGL